MAEADASPPNVRLIDQDLAAIIYTSGSTGEPRGVMLTHRNLVSNARSIAQYLRLTAADRVMCVLPFYYVYGLSLLHTHLLAGGSIVIDNRLAYPNVVVQGMRDHQVTGLSGVPSTFVLLLERSDLGQTDLPHLRYLTQAGGAMPVGRLLELRKRLPGVPVYVMYGATEAAARLTYLEPAMLESKLGSIGRSIPNVAVTILREDGSPASAGEVGELVARGSNISCGYWNAPDETAIRFGPQGYRTGDLGYMDDDGYLFLTGRRHDMIKTGAHRVGPREIEDVLCAHPDVIEAAVVGAPDDILGEIPVAFVSVRHASGLEPAALRNFCAPRLAAHKIPARWHFVPELPKTGAGKVDKVSLRDRLRDEATSPNV
jgi:acyl-CoA synthetase (AMP-forming)/AMP-acid ligase II